LDRPTLAVDVILLLLYTQYRLAQHPGLLFQRMGTTSNGPNIDYGIDGSSCSSPATNSHEIPSKEYASAAAVEGWANYYHAVAFNNTSHSDCAVMWSTQDWDEDGLADLAQTFASMNCDGQPYWGNEPTSADHSVDRLGDFCATDRENRGTEWAWMQFFWDLDTEQALSFSQVAAVFDRADPRNWRKDDSGLNKRPWARVEDAADDLGILAEVTSEGSSNGVDRL